MTNEKTCKICKRPLASKYFPEGSKKCRSCTNKENGGLERKVYITHESVIDLCICRICGKPRVRNGRSVFHDQCKINRKMELTFADVKEVRRP